MEVAANLPYRCNACLAAVCSVSGGFSGGVRDAVIAIGEVAGEDLEDETGPAYPEPEVTNRIREHYLRSILQRPARLPA
jgi:hypothetical protein